MKKKIYIEGMSCGHCSNHVSEDLKDLGGDCYIGVGRRWRNSFKQKGILGLRTIKEI
ncbi:heavy-metal-associated domain-containing protein [Clostridium sp.]|uniref:heavy-metal-associated domain-containing protein n=1 Tax=Clostridium sp. TaxID=1506 RepID=UPI003D6CBE00